MACQQSTMYPIWRKTNLYLQWRLFYVNFHRVILKAYTFFVKMHKSENICESKIDRAGSLPSSSSYLFMSSSYLFHPPLCRDLSDPRQKSVRAELDHRLSQNHIERFSDEHFRNKISGNLWISSLKKLDFVFRVHRCERVINTHATSNIFKIAFYQILTKLRYVNAIMLNSLKAPLKLRLCL